MKKFSNEYLQKYLKGSRAKFLKGTAKTALEQSLKIFHDKSQKKCLVEFIDAFLQESLEESMMESLQHALKKILKELFLPTHIVYATGNKSKTVILILENHNADLHIYISGDHAA